MSTLLKAIHMHIDFIISLFLPLSHNYINVSYYDFLKRFLGFPGCTVVKNLPADAVDTRDMGLIPGSRSSLEKEMAAHAPIFLPGKPCGQRSLAGYSPWGCIRV